MVLFRCSNVVHILTAIARIYVVVAYCSLFAVSCFPFTARRVRACNVSAGVAWCAPVAALEIGLCTHVMMVAVRVFVCRCAVVCVLARGLYEVVCGVRAHTRALCECGRALPYSHRSAALLAPRTRSRERRRWARRVRACRCRR